ncbi:hydrogenobyrinic acid a,c-diamide synthase (glutamine-hydrolysing), cobyrinate a,c-diamide synthase [Desulfosporosinus acidiphilus SJ4]|uniref:Cobyrinate a,c-diamide synthase n=1 Tax=Desulfosporosinus acidiphilus (strain DSM 22704 / JCM 16185 / SJ4) TaxID=646529 RepID=I4D6H0_DESAJ|nr:cobyrinate a,c-diamide synthase [Desulfosporosinus acidiphilus]AFM41394.1 hydrogenobyrinic acid a,c-diamide synthase (glutamine-hydrolysing), cobyrinate a,c-diamide synthase [Desulfosporosinus acidiphilus SJ4]
MKIPRIVLAGTHSGVGKTTLATGLMAALNKRQRPIQGYKVGPDYIDPSYHAAATGRPSRNLDRWLLGERLLPAFLQSSQERWAVIEGVMGMFDGMSGTAGFGSTADVAKLLKAPILLIVDASSMSRSVAALVHGFKTYDPEVNLQGVILNRVKSSAQEKILRDALIELQIPVLGVLPKETSLHLPERHLGLIPVGEGGLLEGYIESLAEFIGTYLDLEQIEKIMLKAPDFPETSRADIYDYLSLDLNSSDNNEILNNSHSNTRENFDNLDKVTVAGGRESGIAKSKGSLASDFDVSNHRFRLGLAWDEAFLFYYQDALDMAAGLNCSVVPFSPLHDQSLPKDLDGIFLGGGFPELHLKELSANVSFLESLRNFAASGKPIYAECGGYMYLGKSITSFDGTELPMAGLIPMKAEMTKRLQGIGYRKGVFREDNFLGPRGTMVQGHEFHYSRVTYESEVPAVYELYKGDQADRLEGYARDNLVASYLHLNFAGQPELMQHWFSSHERRRSS